MSITVNEENVILRLNGITKRFPGTLALDHVQLMCEKGKVHILLGENGAGKSTLVKIISGVYKRDEGTMWYDGQEVHFTDVRQSMDAGISIIHQELKVVIGKWLETGCKFLIIDEPTRGIDIGAKSEIYHLLDQLVAEGYGILMISSELSEVVGISDRVYVMKDGEITGEVEREGLTQEAIMRYAVGGEGT